MLSISVIVPVRNASRTLHDCLQSLCDQTVRPLEIVVVDDGSADDSAAIAGRFPVTVLQRDTAGGAGAARDYGVMRASGDVVAFLDADCVAPPDWLERMAQEFESDAGLGAVGGLYEFEWSGSPVSVASAIEGFYLEAAMDNPSTQFPQGGNSAYRRGVWQNARSGAECVLFAGMASGEDRLVWDEVRAGNRVKIVDSPRVLHRAPTFGQYLRRHIVRGRSGIITLGLARGPDSGSGLAAYGGGAVVASSAFFLLAVIATVSVPFYRWPGVFAVVLAILLHVLSGRPFMRAVRRMHGKPRISLIQSIQLRCLLVVRHACWAIGACLEMAGTLRASVRRWCRVGGAMLHFWVPGRVSRLFFFVTGRCNARCTFCCNLKRGEMAREGAVEELSMDEIRAIAQSIGRLPYVTLTGGEPFLRDDLADIVHVFWRECRTAWVTVTTNGSRPSRILAGCVDVLQRCPGLHLTIQCSVDAVGQAHDASRNMDGCFAKVSDTLVRLGRLREYHRALRVQVATLYEEASVDRVDAVVEYCRAHFSYDQHILYLLRESGARVTLAVPHFLQGYLKMLKRTGTDLRSPRRKSIWNRVADAFGGLVAEDVVATRLHHRDGRGTCHAMRKFITIYENGDVASCEVRDDVLLGNVRNFRYDLYRLLRQDDALRTWKDTIAKRQCVCDWSCAKQINAFYHVRSLWRVLKRVVWPGRKLGAGVPCRPEDQDASGGGDVGPGG